MISTFKTIGRILIILVVAGLIITALSALASSTGDTSTMQPPAFVPSSATTSSTFHPERDEGSASTFGLLELVKNTGVIGLIITAYWFIQKWADQIKRKSRLAV